MFSYALTLAVASTGQLGFMGIGPGPIVDRSAVKGFKVSARISGFVEIDRPHVDRGLNAAGIFTGGNQLPVFPSDNPGKVLIALPYATRPESQSATLKLLGKDYPIRLPISSSFGPYQMPPIVQNLKGIRFETTSPPRPTSLSSGRLSYSVSMPDGGPCMIVSRSPDLKGDPRDSFFLLKDSDDKAPCFGSEVEVFAVKAVPLKLRISNSQKPTEYFLPNGKKLYSSNHRLDESLGYIAVQFRNMVLANFRVQRKREGALSYARVNHGEIVNATGYRKVGKPIRVALSYPALEPLMIPRVQYSARMPELIFQ